MTPARLALALALLLASAGTAAADDDPHEDAPSKKGGPRLHALLGASHAVGAPQGGDFGFGGAGAITGELPIFSCFSAEVLAGGLFLAANDRAPGLPARSTATIAFFTGGVRFHPMPRLGANGPWFGGGAGLAINGSNARFGADGMLGWDFGLAEGRVTVGPFVAYTHVLEPGTDKQSEADAHVIWGGVHVSFGAKRRPWPKESETPVVPVGPDADADGVADTDDACPAAKGVKTNDINTNGCPAGDVDGDGVPNAADACPESKGEKNADPKQNGCPIPQKPANDVEIE